MKKCLGCGTEKNEISCYKTITKWKTVKLVCKNCHKKNSVKYKNPGYTNIKHLNPPKICTIETCNKKMLARGWCSQHLSRFYKHGDPNILLHKTTCTKLDCNRKHSARGLCSRHFEEFRRQSGYRAMYDKLPKTRFTDCKRYAKNRGLEWVIGFNDYAELIQRNCFYCDGPLPATKVGLDRLDNMKGYSLNNVVPCCRYCNQMRSNIFTHEEFKEFSKTELFKTILHRLHNVKQF